jgi:hypothetical protein
MTGADIIKIKDDLHAKWFELQRTKRENPQYAFLQKPIYDQIVALGHKALDGLKDINPRSTHIKTIEHPLHEVERQSWLAEGITHIGYKPYYIVMAQRGRDLITRDINMLANAVHNGGIAEIRYNDTYCGCEIPDTIKSMRAINTGVLKYCQGTLRLEHDRRGRIMGDGDTVEHKPGAAATHANVVKFVPTEDGHDVEMQYTESGDANWKDRQNGVIQTVKDIGGHCEQERLQTKCTITNVSDDKILNLALVMSQLKDIDLAESACIPLAFDLIKRQAGELEEEPPEQIWNRKWTRLEDFKEMMDCVEPLQGGENEEERRSREQERERRKQLFYGRLEREITQMGEDIDYAVAKSKDDPCTNKPYCRLSDVSYNPGSILNACNQIKKETDEAWGWCMDLAKAGTADIKQASKDLVDRCPPEGIILGLEAANFPYSIGQVEEICRMAEDQHCMDIIHQVAQRELQGIHPAKLPFKPVEV